MLVSLCESLIFRSKMKSVHIFIDEFGTPALNVNKEGVVPYFAYAAIVIEESELENARAVHQQVVKKYFNGTHIKSSNIHNDEKGHIKRLNIINDFSAIKHYVVALLVDKAKIESEGLGYKKSFIKFFNRIISEHFKGLYEEIHIHFDKTGRKAFQDELKEYMASHCGIEKTLFSSNTFEVQDDITEEPLIQMADFYAGCIGKYYCGIPNKKHADAIHNAIKSFLFIDWFPIEFSNYFGAQSFDSNAYNKQIATIAIETARSYVENTTNDEVGVEIVKLLLHEAYVNPYRPISSKEIKNRLGRQGIAIGDPIVEISRLRDNGVYIISPIGKKGYKFPCNDKEIAEFFDRISLNVVPQLKRAHILHKILVEQSCGEYNILKDGNYGILSSLIGVIVDR